MLTLSATARGCIFHDGAPGRRKVHAARLQPGAITCRRPSQKGETAMGFVHFPASQRKDVFLPTRKVVNSNFMFAAVYADFFVLRRPQWSSA